MVNIKLDNLCKRYDNGFDAVKNISFDIKKGHFLVLLGPSGCGKSTLLRMIAGLEEITDGKLRFEDKVVNDLAPKDRKIGMVFQNYALYPHLSVYENIAFPLKVNKTPKQEIIDEVNKIAEMLNLSEKLDLKPKQLSGGQKQRVALGRALIRKPNIFLFDEPLSNLDAQLRVQMRNEIIKIHRENNTTSIYVTHDQTEAMTMADEIVLLKDGEIQQIGTPNELYNFPHNIFVAEFIGTPGINIFTKEEFLKLINQEQTIDTKIEICKYVAIRPENLLIKVNGLNLKSDLIVENIENMGYEFLIYIRSQTNQIIVRLSAVEFQNDEMLFDKIKIGTNVELIPKSNNILFYDKDKLLI